MILDRLHQSGRYTALHPAFPRAFDFLATADWAALTRGSASVRHVIDGDRIYVSIDEKDGRGRDGARLEAHRRYIDIQMTIGGEEEIGWRALADCRQPAGPFDHAKDIVFFDDRPDTWLCVPPGGFAIFFPEDAHAPLAGRGLLKKAIVKIAIEREDGETVKRP
jgi:YhcH/YjgK/YiaL family protein